MGIPMTKKGYSNLEKQADDLRDKIPDIQVNISEARAKGDLSENAEYHAARESLGMIEAKISDIMSRLAQAQIIKEGGTLADGVAIGAKVKVFDKKYKEEEVYYLVGMGEEDPMENRILTNSPMSQAMLNKKVGDEFVVDAPKGKLAYKILDISY